MRKEDKSIAIEKIVETLKEYPNFYLVETAGLNAEKTSELRRACLFSVETGGFNEVEVGILLEGLNNLFYCN